jgi:hypothetical protein
VEHPGEERSAFPSYEELSADLIEAIDQAGLFIEDVRHHLEPSVGERRFECTVRLSSGEPPSRYHVHLSFAWDALLTYVAAYGAGADCDLYHDDEEAEDCPHHQLPPQPFVELEAEFILGDGGYGLRLGGHRSGVAGQGLPRRGPPLRPRRDRLTGDDHPGREVHR